MKFLFAILSILLFLIGVKTHRRIHAIAGIIFMAMLLGSIVTERMDGSSAIAWIAGSKGGAIHNDEALDAAVEGPSSSLETVEETKSPTGQMVEEEPSGSAGQPTAEETASPGKQPAVEETPSPEKKTAPEETPSPVRQQAPEETESPTKQPVQGEVPSPMKGSAERTAVPSPVKTASPSPQNEEEVKTYQAEDYGVVEKEEQQFFGEDGEVSYYYKMESFYLSDTYSRRVNATLQKIYDEYEAQYLRTAELIESGFNNFDEPISGTPYDYWQLVGLQYVGRDYISVLYNDIPYMSNTHPYSRFDGITINCRTGKEVTASEFLEKSDQEILEDVSNQMGLDEVATWDDIDFYLTDSTIVFFYRVPDWWEDVSLPRA